MILVDRLLSFRGPSEMWKTRPQHLLPLSFLSLFGCGLVRSPIQPNPDLFWVLSIRNRFARVLWRHARV